MCSLAATLLPDVLLGAGRPRLPASGQPAWEQGVGVVFSQAEAEQGLSGSR